VSERDHVVQTASFDDQVVPTHAPGVVKAVAEQTKVPSRHSPNSDSRRIDPFRLLFPAATFLFASRHAGSRIDPFTPNVAAMTRDELQSRTTDGRPWCSSDVSVDDSHGCTSCGDTGTRQRALSDKERIGRRRGKPAAGDGARMSRCGTHMLAALVLFLSCVQVQSAGSGMFRFGHISWAAQGSKVSFTIETAFRKSVSKVEFRDAKIGDHLALFGKEPPQFLYGDSQYASTMTMEVTAVSNTEDWVMGVTHLTHTYATPNNQQRPWKAQLVGCCRISEIVNNAGLGFEITAEVDLTTASRSPRAATLPVITVPLAGKSMPGAIVGAPPIPPSAYIPSRSGANVQWGVGTPVDVGNAAALKSSARSYLQLPLSPLQSGHTCAQSSVGGGCLVQMLSGDPSVGGGGAAMTVEGWVKIASPQGGHILSTDHLSATGKRISTLCV